jgi:hypothetical protein
MSRELPRPVSLVETAAASIGGDVILYGKIQSNHHNREDYYHEGMQYAHAQQDQQCGVSGDGHIACTPSSSSSSSSTSPASSTEGTADGIGGSTGSSIMASEKGKDEGSTRLDVKFI